MRFIAESNPRFERFAAREPYFAVFTTPRHLRANFDAAARRAFFLSGEELVARIFRTIEKHLFPGFKPSTALEYGCGVGRLAIPLAARVPHVTAVDVSPAMLAVARENAIEAATPHIAFETAREFFATDARFDLVTCYFVLQRLRPHDGLDLLRALLGRIAPDGAGVFHIRYRRESHPLDRLRESVSPVNGAINVLRRKSFGDPFIATHAYDLADVLDVIASEGLAATHVTFDASDALLFVRRPGERVEAKPAEAPSEELIDVRQIIASTSIEDLNRTAEEYFAGLTSWDHHLAKPFVTSDEASTILLNFATVLQALKLAPGMKVLEFGAGTGWLSRAITQLGGEAILLDVSPTALRIARELYDKMPVIGSKPSPQFLPFDGRRIELPDESVDRIVSFDAFHHAPNPEAVIAELARVLRPGGLAVFAEPGPHHSKSPQSQYEMRLYRVLENDVDVHAIRRTAQQQGFTKFELILFHIAPFRVSLADYDDFLAGGVTTARWLESSRAHLGNVRNFVMTKAGEERSDSRASSGLACTVAVTLAEPARGGEPLVFDATVTNRGTAIWLPSDREFGGVVLGAHLYDTSGALMKFDFHWQRLTDPPREIEPGETIQVRATLPPLDAGRYRIEFDCVAAGVCWFEQAGGGGAATVAIDVV